MALKNLILPRYKFEDYLQWEGNWELIEGIPFAMNPLPVPKHQLVASSLNWVFVSAIKKVSCKKCKVYQPIDYKVNHETVLAPDLLIVCKPINKKFLDFAPSLVVEILSPSTALRDRHTKFEIYEGEGIAYYLIVDIENEKIDIYSLQNGVYQLINNSNTPFSFTLIDGCIITPNLEDVWESE